MISITIITLSGCGRALRELAPGRPELRDIDVTVSGLDLTGVDLQFALQVSNPYPVAINSPHFTWSLAVMGEEFIKANDPLTANLPARQVGTITVPVRISYEELWQVYRDLKQETEADYEFSGNFLLTALGTEFEIPFQHHGTFPVFHLPRISNFALKSSETGLTGAYIQGEARLLNPNGFTLDVSKVGYTFMIGNSQVGDLVVEAPEHLAAQTAGTLNLSGHLSTIGVLTQVIAGESLRDAKISIGGTISTPYGDIEL